MKVIPLPFRQPADPLCFIRAFSDPAFLSRSAPMGRLVAPQWRAFGAPSGRSSGRGFPDVTARS